MAEEKQALLVVGMNEIRMMAGELSTENFSSRHPEEALNWLLPRIKSIGVEIKESEKERKNGK
jgi:hypothetical protein